jgi:osmotically inducible protein OsmC
LRLLASRAGMELTDLVVDAAVTFARDPVDGLFLLSADIRVSLPGVDRSLAAELVRNTERICPYAKMFRRGIDHVVAVAHERESPHFNDETPS